MDSEDGFSLAGRKALVTGASRGLGRAIAIAFARAGADVALVARGLKALEDVARHVRDVGGRAWPVTCDLGRLKEISSTFDRIKAEAGDLDILVNVAGTTRRGSSLEFSLEDWQRILDVNLTASFLCSQWFARQCVEANKPGKIINIASLLSERGRAATTAYAASKGGIRQMTKVLAVEWAPHRINVNAIGPGYFDTELTRPLVEDAAFNKFVVERTPLGRWGAPDDLTGAAVFLASSASDFVTGQVIYVDGGWLAGL